MEQFEFPEEENNFPVIADDVLHTKDFIDVKTEVRAANLGFQPIEELKTKLTVSDACHDVISLHTIALLHHNRKVQSFIDSHQQKNIDFQKSYVGEHSMLEEVLQIPELPECILKYRRPGDISSRLPYENDNDFVEGKGCVLPILSHNVVWKMLRKSVAVICAHVGYETVSDLVLDILTDVAQDYYTRLCAVLSKNVNNRGFTGHADFVDVLEQTFHDIGLGSMTTLHYFYQNRIVDYHDRVLQSCKLLMEEYEKLKIMREHPKQENE